MSIAPETAPVVRVPVQTTPPGKYMVIYDGLCRFCTIQCRHLLKLARPGAFEAVSFQEPGALERFPGLTHEICMQAMCLVTPEGRIYRGFEGIIRALATRRFWGRLAYIYYVPGLRQLCDLAYRIVAANRYRLLGKVEPGACPTGTCAVHIKPPR